MTNSKMIETSTERFGSPSSYGYNHRQAKGYVRPRISKSTSYFQSIVTPPRGKHRRTESQEVNFNHVRPLSFTGMAAVHLAINASRQDYLYFKSRTSPSKEGSPGSSPTLGGFYAGAKFSEPPAPNALPKPPTHWTSSVHMQSGGLLPLVSPQGIDKCREISNQLKMLLNVSA